MVLSRFDWDFKEIFKAADGSEVIACCCYEYARESSTIRAHYNGEKPPNLPTGIFYHPRIEGIIRTMSNPLLWPWPSLASEAFAPPWQDLDAKWRIMVTKHYKLSYLAPYRPAAFRSGHSGYMKKEIVSGNEKLIGTDPETSKERVVIELDWTCTDEELLESFSRWLKEKRRCSYHRAAHRLVGFRSFWNECRKGIDQQNGNERAVVEIDWCCSDSKLIESFKLWLKNERPRDIGIATRNGLVKDNCWKRKLDNLTAARLRSRYHLSNIPLEVPMAVQNLDFLRGIFGKGGKEHQNDDHVESRKREFYKKCDDCPKDFRELFPFLPKTEKPRCCKMLNRSQLSVN